MVGEISGTDQVNQNHLHLYEILSNLLFELTFHPWLDGAEVKREQ